MPYNYQDEEIMTMIVPLNSVEILLVTWMQKDKAAELNMKTGRHVYLTGNK